MFKHSILAQKPRYIQSILLQKLNKVTIFIKACKNLTRITQVDYYVRFSPHLDDTHNHVQ